MATKLGIELRAPVTQEALAAAAALLKPLLPSHFYGGIRLVYEDGRCIRAAIDQSELLKMGR
jgi:hypothetical protein